ncbi:hypothetical protein C2G38_2034437 [Gigaspora rosea]|uniref:SWIM-type domain-containing protein n=1 Tax=Gigaspora rosea TaxID=44941 RepID=A0A397VNA1_9GLOM|nr:hypothetical protein C2G38_2034437 [Gigaspora rosea]
MDPLDRNILAQEFSHAAYLSPSTKRDKSAKRLLEIEKVIKYEVEELSGKIYVEVESETTSDFIYTTCVYGQPTDICCQCFDFLQRGILCKHLHAAALYINKVRKQEQFKDLPEIKFPIYEEAQSIYHHQYANKIEVSVSSRNDNENDKGDEDIDDESNGHDNKSNNHDNSDNSHITTSFKEIFNYIENILGINTLSTISLSNALVSTKIKSTEISIDALNTTAISKQKFKEFLESTLRSFQTLQENSLLLQNLVESNNPLIQEQYNKSDQCTLLTHLLDFITSNSFEEARKLVEKIYKDTNPHRHVVFGTDIFPLEQETKQKRKQSYKS